MSNLREFVEHALQVEGLTYTALAERLADVGIPTAKGGQWTRHAAYNLARQYGIKSIRPCKSQPRAARSQTRNNTARGLLKMKIALESGRITTAVIHDPLTIDATAAALGLTKPIYERCRSHYLTHVRKSGPTP